jgi:hypothetical protein
MCNEFRDISFAYQSGESNVSGIIAHAGELQCHCVFMKSLKPVIVS